MVGWLFYWHWEGEERKEFKSEKVRGDPTGMDGTRGTREREWGAARLIFKGV